MLAKDLRQAYTVAFNYWHLSIILEATGDLGRARECAKEALRISQECDAKGQEVWHGLSLGVCWRK